MHRPGMLPRRGGEGARGGGDGGAQLERARRVRGRGGQVHRQAREGAEHACLPRGLVRADLPQLGRPVRREDEQRDPGVMRLHHRGVEVCGGGAGGGDHRGGAGGVVTAEAEGGEGGGALVDPHVGADAPGDLRGCETVDQRGGAGTGREHRLGEPELGQRRPQRDRLVHGAGAGGARGGDRGRCGQRSGVSVHLARVVLRCSAPVRAVRRRRRGAPPSGRRGSRPRRDGTSAPRSERADGREASRRPRAAAARPDRR